MSGNPEPESSFEEGIAKLRRMLAADGAYEDLARVFPGPVDAELPIYRFEDADGNRSGPLIPDDAIARAAKWWTREETVNAPE